MADRNLWRDSVIIAAIVVLFAYASALVLGLVTGATPSDQVVGNIALAAILFLVVLGLGFLLWRSEAGQLRA